MKKEILFLIMILSLSFYAHAADMPANGHPPAWASEKQPRILLDDGSVVGKDNPMPVDAEVNIGSITVDALPVYKDETGKAATAEIDINDRVKVNLGSETIGLIDAINAVTSAISGTLTADTNISTDSIGLMAAIEPVTEVDTQVVTLVADTSQAISSGLTGERKFIEITAMDNTKDFWLDFGTPAVQDSCRRVYGGIYLEIDKNITPNILASEALDIMVIEGGY